MQPAHVQQSIREHMPPLRVGAKLDLVDGHEIRADSLGHRLDRGDPILGAIRYDPFLAGDQRDDVRPAQRDDPVIDLARKQTQRKPDYPRAMGEHPFDGIVSLARVRRAENGRNPRHKSAFGLLDRAAFKLALEAFHRLS